jgi:molybdate transport system ATP-binding protein
MAGSAAAPAIGTLMLSVAASKQRAGFALDVRFDLPGPGVVALFGRSGCGKSTVINLIAGLLNADTGRVVLDDVVLLDTSKGIHLPTERRRIGYVFQDARLFPHLSVRGNLEYAQRRAVGRPYVTLEAVLRLLDIGPLLNRGTHQLSGGERQRVAIGRALLIQPRLLLLDEPLAALDAARREEVLPYLETLRDELALPMVYVTHDFEEVLRLATHLVLMERGSVTAQGNLGTMSLEPSLRSIVGPDQVGAIIDGRVLGFDTASQLCQVSVGDGTLNVRTRPLSVGTPLRVQLLARDIIVSTRAPQHLSVRNALAGVLARIDSDAADSDLVTIDIGMERVMARITRAATRELELRPGMPVWALVKSVSLRGYPRSPHA